MEALPDFSVDEVVNLRKDKVTKPVVLTVLPPISLLKIGTYFLAAPLSKSF